METTKKGPSRDLKTAALEYANKGIPVFPLKSGDKTPIHYGGFHNATTDPHVITQWWEQTPDANIGMPTGPASGIWVLDIDNKTANGFDCVIEWEMEGLVLPSTRAVATPNRGTHLHFNYSTRKITNRTGIVPGIDIRGDGGYVVLPPSLLANGEAYEWQKPDALIDDAPEWLLDIVLAPAKHKPQPILTAFQLDTVAIPNGQRNDTLIRMAGSFRKYGVSEDQIFEWLWATNLSRCTPPLTETEVRQIATSAKRWQSDALQFPLTDSGNAELLAHLHHGQLLYDHKMSRWLVWQQYWWAEDNTGEINRRAKQVARERQAQTDAIADEGKRKTAHQFAMKSENRNRIEACINLAKFEPELSDAGDGWDADPWLLGVENGVVDLKNGHLERGNPSDCISLHANVTFAPMAICPRWEQFMEEVFSNDRDLIDYVQRAVGYSLTGMTTEHVMFLAYGAGANGKSVMLRVLTDLLGGYAKVTPSCTLDTGYKSSISNDVAALAKRRLVWASETEQASTLNEAKVKQLVHGDEITARHLYQEFFTFTPIAKFWYTVNDLPTVRDGSHGMWRSLHVIPFLMQFDGDKADPALTDKLKAELPGILNWAIKGCLDWQQTGLRPPKLVTEATSDYRQENDVLADFLAAYCERGDDKSDLASLLYKGYVQWADNCGLKERDTLSDKAFFKRLKSMFKCKRTNKGTTYLGLQIIAPSMGPG